MKAVIDENCIGCSLCTQICADVFKMEGEKAIVHTSPTPEDVEEECRNAAEECSVDAIEIQE